MDGWRAEDPLEGSPHSARRCGRKCDPAGNGFPTDGADSTLRFKATGCAADAVPEAEENDAAEFPARVGDQPIWSFLPKRTRAARMRDEADQPLLEGRAEGGGCIFSGRLYRILTLCSGGLTEERHTDPEAVRTERRLMAVKSRTCPKSKCRSPAACSCPPRPEPPGRSAACGSPENRCSRTPSKASERPAWRKVKAFCRTPLFAERYCGNVFEYVPISGQRTLSKSFPDSADVRSCGHHRTHPGRRSFPAM